MRQEEAQSPAARRSFVNQKQTWTPGTYRLKRMASLVLRVAYRPLRIGFLVRNGEIQDILEAVKLNTVLWGGMRNPLIPITADSDSGRQLVKLFRVDVLYPVTDSTELHAFLEFHPHLSWPEVSRNQHGLFDADDKWLNAVDVVPWILRYEGRYSDEKPSPYVLVTWNSADPLAPMLATTFGLFPTADMRLPVDYKSIFADVLKAQEAPILSNQGIHDFLPFRTSSLAFTVEALVPDRLHTWLHHGIYAGDVDATDLINFWNLRASGVDLHFVPLDFIDRDRNFITAQINRLAEWARRDKAAFRHLGLWHRQGREIPQEISDLFPRDVRSSRVQVNDGIWNGLNVRPPLYKLDERSVMANLDFPSEGSPSVGFSLPRELDLTGLPIEHQWQQCAISISPLTEFAYDGHTLMLPFLPDLNRWYSRQVLITPNKLRVEIEGISKITAAADETMHLNTIRADDVAYQVVERASIRTEPSLPGRIAQQLIKQMDGLEGCRVFKIRGVRKLIASPDSRDGVTRSRATEVIRDMDPTSRQPSFSKFETLSIERREKSRLNPTDVFNYLLKKEIFRPGLELKCPRCTLLFWVSMPVQETCRCELCGHSFAIAPYLEDRGDWRFRLSGLFGRKGGEEGAIPVVLTLLQLLRIHDHGEAFLYTCGTILRIDGQECEADLIVIERGREGNPSVMLGECKSSSEIDDQDIANFEAAHERIERSGIRCYLLFAKTANTFSDGELHRFRQLAARGIPSVLFTARELEPYEPYDEVPDRERLPARHPMDFKDLARNSSWLYLREQTAQ